MHPSVVVHAGEGYAPCVHVRRGAGVAARHRVDGGEDTLEARRGCGRALQADGGARSGAEQPSGAGSWPVESREVILAVQQGLTVTTTGLDCNYSDCTTELEVADSVAVPEPDLDLGDGELGVSRDGAAQGEASFGEEWGSEVAALAHPRALTYNEIARGLGNGILF